jgi:hypothetical protein
MTDYGAFKIEERKREMEYQRRKWRALNRRERDSFLYWASVIVAIGIGTLISIVIGHEIWLRCSR